MKKLCAVVLCLALCFTQIVGSGREAAALAMEVPVASITDAGNTTSYTTIEEAVEHWVSGSTLTLLRDVVTDRAVEVPVGLSLHNPGSYTLDLNNHGIINKATSGSAIRINIYNDVTINDTAETKTTRYIILDENGRGIDVSDTAPVSGIEGEDYVAVTGGFLTGGTGLKYQNRMCGGGIFVEDSRLTINNGTIVGNTADNGGGVYLLRNLNSDTSLTMNGNSTIESNYTKSYGGGISFNDFYGCDSVTNKIFLTGSATIKNNVSDSYIGGIDINIQKVAISVKDSVVISGNSIRKRQNMYTPSNLRENRVIEVCDTFSGNINITTTTTVRAANGYSLKEEDLINFHCDNKDYKLCFDDNQNVVTTLDPDSDFAKLKDKLDNASTDSNEYTLITLEKDQIIHNSLQIEKNTYVIIDLNGHTIDEVDYYDLGIDVWGTLIIDDSSEEKKGNITRCQVGVWVSENANFTMNAGNITGNCSYGVYCKNASFTMNGGMISQNYGGVVINKNSSFTMNGGIISQNYDGGVYVDNSALFNMNGGVITENVSGSGASAGGVYVRDGGRMTVSGDSSIYGNTGNYSGRGQGLSDNLLIGSKSFRAGKMAPTIIVTGKLSGEIDIRYYPSSGNYYSYQVCKSPFVAAADTYNGGELTLNDASVFKCELADTNVGIGLFNGEDEHFAKGLYFGVNNINVDDMSNFTYTGETLNPIVNVSDSNGSRLTLDTDYKLFIAKDGVETTPKMPGKYSVTIIGNYLPDNTGYGNGKATIINKEYVIDRMSNAVVTSPAGNSLVEDGTEKELVTGGTAKCGNFVYAVTTTDKEPADSAYSENIPKAKDAGTYYVWYKVNDAETYEGIDVAYTTVTVKAAPVETNDSGSGEGTGTDSGSGEVNQQENGPVNGSVSGERTDTDNKSGSGEGIENEAGTGKVNDSTSGEETKNEAGTGKVDEGAENTSVSGEVVDSGSGEEAGNTSVSGGTAEPGSDISTGTDTVDNNNSGSYTDGGSGYTGQTSNGGNTLGTGTSNNGVSSTSGSDTKDNKDKDSESSADTVITKNQDGSETKTVVTKNEDGSETTDTVVTKADGSVTDTKITTKTDGTTVKEEVEKDAKGKTLSTTVQTSSVDENKTVTVVTKTENVDGTSTSSEVSTTKKGTVTVKEETVDADKNVTTYEGEHKKNGEGSSKSKTVDAAGNVLSTTTEKTTVSKDKTVTIKVTIKNADGSSVKTKSKTDKDGNTNYKETVKNTDDTKTIITGEENADGTGSKTITTKDEQGNVLSTTEEITTIDIEGTITVKSTTENADGSKLTRKTSTSASGKVKVSNTFTDAKGNKTKLKEEIKQTKKGKTKVALKKTDTTGKKGSKQTTKLSGKVVLSKKGVITGTLTLTAADGTTQEIPINANLKDLGMEGMDVSEIIEFLLQTLIVKK